MKYTIEAFRDTSVDGVGLSAGKELAHIETDGLPFATLQKALASGAAELVPVKEEAQDDDSEGDQQPDG